MRKILIHITILLATVLFSTGLEAQQVNLGQVRIVQNRFEQQGDSLHVALTVDMNGLSINRKRAFTLTPVIESGTESIELPAIVINGAQREKAYQRALAFHRGIPPFPIYTTVMIGHQSWEKVSYKVSIPYEKWMKTSKLSLRENFYATNGDSRLISVNTLAPSLAMEYEPEGVIAHAEEKTVKTEPVIGKAEEIPVKAEVTVKVAPPVVKETINKETKKTYTKEGSAYLDFPANQTHILPDYRGNDKELGKIRATLDSLICDPNLEIVDIDMIGYASPEGTFAQNEVLSRERTIALRNYLRGRYQLPANIYRVDWRGEDWIGLKQLILRHGMPDEDRVLDIIENYGVFEGREKRLMDLKNGQPYRYMLKPFFPKLRRVDYKITYKIINNE